MLTQFLEFILFALFFIRKKSAAKEAEKRAVLSLCQRDCNSESARLSPLVIFARTSQKFGGTTRRGNASQTFYGLRTRYRRVHIAVYFYESPLRVSFSSVAKNLAAVYCADFAGGARFSLRLGHARGLTVHRTVIQHPRAASLPLPYLRYGISTKITA